MNEISIRADTKTWLTDDTNYENLCEPSNYSCSGSHQNEEGGGRAIFFSQRSIHKKSKFPALKFIVEKITVCLLLVYHSACFSYKTFLIEFSERLSYASVEDRFFYTLVDFNIPTKNLHLKHSNQPWKNLVSVIATTLYLYFISYSLFTLLICSVVVSTLGGHSEEYVWILPTPMLCLVPR